MKRYTVIGLLLSIMLILSGCSDKNGTESATASINGVAQKGPFLKGSTVEVYKVEDNGSVGDLIETSSIDNNGTYKIDLNTSGLVLIKITGKYFNEINKTISNEKVTLENILKINKGEKRQANTNILTHLTAVRTLALLQNNTNDNLDEAFEEAKKDIAEIFEDVGINENTSFEELDISENEDLLKISAAFAYEENLTTLTSDVNTSEDINISIDINQTVNSININEINNTLSIFKTNQAPVINWLKYNGSEINNTLTVNEDIGSISIDLNATDEDDNNLTLEVDISQNDTIVDGNISEQNISSGEIEYFTLNVIPNKYGEVNITVTVSDGMKLDVKTFTLKINPVSNAPVINSLKYNNTEINSSGITKNEDFTPFTIDVNASDIDNSSLTLDVIANPQIVNIEKNVSNMSFTIYPVQNSSGDVNITVVVSDGEMDVNQSFTLAINPVNDAPVINSLKYNNTEINSSGITKNEDFTPFTIDVNASDIDNSSLTLDVIANPQIVNIEKNVSNMSFTIYPVQNSSGDVNITVVVSDGELETNQTFTLTINPVNDAPIINSINFNNSPIDSNISVVEGSGSIVIDLNISDVDDTNLSIVDINDSKGLTTYEINGTTVTLTPNGSTGETTITITVSDGEVNTTKSFTLEIYPQLNGRVVDGYVKNAKIEIFDDNTYTNLIGQGSTNSNGSFTITLNTTNLPNPVYIKSTGGVIIENGMLAPTMLFVGNKNSDGEYIITPITNIVAEKEKSGINLDSIKEQLANDLNLTEDALFINPETNETVKNVLKQKVLPASTFASTLADGNYTAYIIYFDKDSIDENKTITSVDDIEQNIIPIPINISDGNISAPLLTDEEGETYAIRGYVSGTTVLLELVPTNSPDHYVSLAGTVGLYGSVAGVVATFGDSYITPGVFVGQFVPQDINNSQVQKMITDTTNMIAGRENLLFRLNIGGSGMGVCSINITPDQNRSLTLSNVNVIGETFTLIADNNESKFLSVSINNSNNTFPTNLAVMKYRVAEDGTPVYFIQPVGLRKGMIITTDNNKVDEIGDVYISKSGTIAPALKTGTNYTMKVGIVHAGMIGMNRNSILPYISISQNMTTPNVNTSGADNYLREPTRIEFENEVMFFNDSVIGMYNGGGDGDINTTDDYMRTLQIYNSGAFDGENIIGGSLPNGDELQNYPGFFVGYFKEQNSNATISPDGEYDFIARSLYFSNDIDKPTLVRGKLIIENDGGSATIEVFDENGSFPLSIDCANGLCHIKGYGSDGDYIDIVWPIGGKKGLYVVSDGESGPVFEVGEAYISQ